MVEESDNPPGREDQYWDAFVRGEHPRSAIDPALAEAIARAHRLDDAPAPDPSFVSFLERRLAGVAAGRRDRLSLPLGLTSYPNGVANHSDSRPVRRSGASRRSILAQLATAALLVLTITASFAALRWRPDRPAERAFLPALADWSSTLLLRTTLNDLPAGSLAARIDRWTLPPGAGEWQGIAPSLPQLLYVEEGQLTATVDARATLSRASAVKRLAAAVPSNSPISLRAGDLLVVPAGARFVLASAGDGSVAPKLLIIYLTPPNGSDPAAFTPSGISVTTLGAGTLTDLPAGPGVVALHDVFVAPWVALPAATTVDQELLVVAAGTAGLRKGPDVPEVTRVARGDTSTVVAPGTLLALRNPDDKPLIVLRLSITPISSGNASPAARRPGQDGDDVGAADPERPEEG